MNQTKVAQVSIYLYFSKNIHSKADTLQKEIGSIGGLVVQLGKSRERDPIIKIKPSNQIVSKKNFRRFPRRFSLLFSGTTFTNLIDNSISSLWKVERMICGSFRQNPNFNFLHMFLGYKSRDKHLAR